MPVPSRIAVSLFLILLASGCGARRHPGSAALDFAGLRRQLLPNGTTIIVHEHHGADVVAVQLWVRAGARDETKVELGLAHYLEHMLFKGTPSRSPGFVDRDVERVGGRINAGTSLDYTYYHAVLPASRVAPIVRMLADIAVNALLDETLLDNEKRIVLEEMRLHEDNPRRFLAQRLWGLIFQGHPYGRPIIGCAELIRALTAERLRAFYRSYYRPQSFALVVVGAVNADEVLSVATEVFGRLPRTDGGRRAAATPAPLPAGRSDQVTRPGTHAYLGLAWLAPRMDHVDTAAMKLLVGILGQSRSSRLTVALRDRLGIVQSIVSGYSALEAGGVVSITAQLDADQLTRVESKVIDEVRRLGETGVTAEELRRAITAAEAAHEFSLETAEGRAYALGRAETVWNVESELAWIDRLWSVTREQLRSVARRYLDPVRYARLAVVPPQR